MKIHKLIPYLGLLLFLSACFPEPEKKIQSTTPKINEKEFLNHEIINDSIEVRIKEYNDRNLIYRNLCIFKHDKVIKEHLIYKVNKTVIFDEGYNTEIKKMYELKEKNLIEVYDCTLHYFDYNIENVDTIITKVEVAPNGEIILLSSKN